METVKKAVTQCVMYLIGFRSDYEGWKQYPYVAGYQNFNLIVLEVTMRDGNLNPNFEKSKW